MKILILKKFSLLFILFIFFLARLASAQALIIERINIVGARKTKPYVFQRYLSFHEGEAITPELIESNQQTLLSTNFFKQVEFSTAPGSEKGKVIVIIEVREHSAPTLEFAGGYSELDGWYVSPIGVRYDNLFGTGHFLGLRVIIGDRVGGFNFRFQQPEIFKRSVNLQIDFDVLGRDLIHYFDNRQAIQRIAAANLRLTFSGARGLAKYFAAGFQSGAVEPDSTAKLTAKDSTITAFPPIIAEQLGKNEIGMVWLRLQTDTRDNVFFPRRGVWGALSVERANQNFGEAKRFTRTTFDGRLYQSIGASVLAIRLKTGAASKATPYYERFYLGGAYSLRGFAERSLTPVGYGTRLFLGSLEWRIPLESRDRQKPRLVGAIFFDAGSLGTPETERRDDKIFTTFGFGVRWKVPVVGLLRFDFAYPNDRPDNFRFHLAIGHPF